VKVHRDQNLVPACLAVLGLLFYLGPSATSQDLSFPHNATSCDHCHALPAKFGSSPMTVQRVGSVVNDRFVPGPEGGIAHRYGGTAGAGQPVTPPGSSRSYSVTPSQATDGQITGDRVTLSLMGDGYIEAIDGRDIEQNAERQSRLKSGINGSVVYAPALESTSGPSSQVGRFGWKSQHSSLMSACADSLRNELGIRNRLYPAEYATHTPQSFPTPMEVPDGKTGRTQLDRLVDEVRYLAPPPPDPKLRVSLTVKSGEKIFGQIGCQLCHVSTYKTRPAGTQINGGMYVIPDSIGSTTIHPYSDFLLHDVGTGDGIPQAARVEILDPATANKFRTAPLWGLRSRGWLMHDGKSSTYEDAIRRHRGEADAVRRRYEKLSPVARRQLLVFLDSL
jgi:CxxC motif-containing protein (DUF1111 family)